MRKTSSRCYDLPNTAEMLIGKTLLCMARFVPMCLTEFYLRRQRFYQSVRGIDPEKTQGDSSKKWDAIIARCDFDFEGKRVLDIGCAEGAFCLAALKSGASYVLGVDSEWRTLVSAHFLARSQGLKPKFGLGVFPNIGTEKGEHFDCVLCLSVLHHLMSIGDMWLVLTDPRYSKDLITLRKSLLALRALVTVGGVCIIEIPYQYRDDVSRRSADFSRFTHEVISCGFSDTKVLGTWESAARNRSIKDRVLYASYA